MAGRNVTHPESQLTSTDFLLVGNLGVQVAAVCVVHHNAEAALVHERLLVRDDVRVPHRLQHVHLIEKKAETERMNIINIPSLLLALMHRGQPKAINIATIYSGGLTSLMASSRCFLSIFETSMI